MDLDEARRRLDDALKVRIPVFDPDEHPGVKITKLENHILQVAWHRGELEEALHWVMEAGKVLRAQWSGIEGYEAALGSRASRATKEDVERAKATMEPEMWTGLEEARFLMRSLERQIARLGGSDYDAASRAYTFINGR